MPADYSDHGHRSSHHGGRHRRWKSSTEGRLFRTAADLIAGFLQGIQGSGSEVDRHDQAYQMRREGSTGSDISGFGFGPDVRKNTEYNSRIGIGSQHTLAGPLHPGQERGDWTTDERPEPYPGTHNSSRKTKPAYGPAPRASSHSGRIPRTEEQRDNTDSQRSAYLISRHRIPTGHDTLSGNLKAPCVLHSDFNKGETKYTYSLGLYTDENGNKTQEHLCSACYYKLTESRNSNADEYA